MGKGHREFPKLKGASNFDSWSQDIKQCLIVDGLWKWVVGVKKQPTKPTRPGNDSPTATQEAYRRDKASWEKDQEEFDDKHLLACALILLSVDSKPKVHITGVINATRMAMILRNHYGSKDKNSVNNYLVNITRSTQKQFESLDDYAQHIRLNEKKLIDMGLTIPDWILAGIFQSGLNENLRPLATILLYAAKQNKTELTMEDMLFELQEPERHTQEETTKTNAHEAKKLNQSDNNRGRSKRGRGSRFRGRGGRNTTSKSDLYCDGCEIPGHEKKDCFILNKDKRPDWWTCPADKEHLLPENKKKTRKTDTTNGSKESKAHKVVHVFKTKQIQLSSSTRKQIAKKAYTKKPKDDNWWMDSAADVHITHDRSLFRTYRSLTNENVVVANDTPVKVHGIGTIELNILINGEEHTIGLENTWHVPDLAYNLLSLGTLDQKGYPFRSDGRGKLIVSHQTGKVAMTGTRRETGYQLDISNKSDESDSWSD